jgi:tetratricopeptide (TPR) repeat protein
LELNEFEKLDALCLSMSSQANRSPSETCELEYLRIAAAAESGAAPMTQLLLQLGDVLARGVEFPHSRTAHVLLMRIADKTGDYVLARQTARHLRRSGTGGRLDRHSLLAAGYVFTKYFFAARALPLLKRAMEAAQEDNDWATECFCRDCLGIALKQTGRFRDSIAQFNTSLALTRKTMNPHGEARCLQNRAVSEMALGDWPQVFKTLDEADSLPHASWAFRTFNVYNRAVTYMQKAELNRAFDFFAKARELATHHAIRYMAADATAGMALVSIRLGEWRDFEHFSREAVSIEHPDVAPRAGWSVPTIVAWRQAVIEGDSSGAIASLDRQARKAVRLDVAFGLALQLERLLLLEYTTGKRAEAVRQEIRQRATHYEASGIVRACQ